MRGPVRGSHFTFYSFKLLLLWIIQCSAHRIGQIRDVHIYRFVTAHTVEESLLRKANQKRSLDDIVIRQGEFDWRNVLGGNDAEIENALAKVDDVEDAEAARNAAKEIFQDSAHTREDFDDSTGVATGGDPAQTPDLDDAEDIADEDEGTVASYMLRFVERDWAFFSEWRST